MVTEINLEDIREGDWLTVQDSRGNRIRGPVLRAHDRVEVGGFNTAVLVAKRPRLNAALSIAPGLAILDHQPQLFPT